jgi:hypothetical protein
MNRHISLQQIIGMTLVLFLSPTCSTFQSPSTPTPVSYYGIDEPASVQYVCEAGPLGIKGNSFNGFVTIIDAYKIESVTVGEDTIYPESGKVYFSIQTFPKFESDLCPHPQDIGKQLKLVCGNEQFDAAIFSMIFVIDVGINSIFTYETPKDIDFSECYLLLPDEATIPISPVLSSDKQ